LSEPEILQKVEALVAACVRHFACAEQTLHLLSWDGFNSILVGSGPPFDAGQLYSL
jgi:hypothetical protein